MEPGTKTFGVLHHLAGSGRTVFIPEGLHGADEIFPLLVSRAGLELEFYSVPAVFAKGDSASPEFDAMLEKHPALILVPAAVQLDSHFCKKAAGKLPVIGSVSSGTDHADLDMLKKAGIHYIHAPGANALSVAEYVLVAAGLFHDLNELLNEKFGIIGFGRVGRKLASALKKLRIGFQWYDPFVRSEEFSDENGSLPEVLDSGIITFHVSLTKSGPHPTYGMIDDNYIKLFNKNALVINTSRGAVFSEESFFRVCREFRTVMDVFPSEPPSRETLLLPDYVTPHIAGYSWNARAGGTLTVARNFLKLLGIGDPGLRYSTPVFDHYVTDFIKAESENLKSGKTDFLKRRSAYPPRGSVADAARLHHRKDAWTEHLMRIFSEHEI